MRHQQIAQAHGELLVEGAVALTMKELVIGQVLFLGNDIEQGVYLLVKRHVRIFEHPDTGRGALRGIRLEHLGEERILGLEVMVGEPRRHVRLTSDVAHGD